METAELIESQITEIREKVGYTNKSEKIPYSEELVTETQKVVGENYLFILIKHVLHNIIYY
jgi:hypothetical protein